MTTYQVWMLLTRNAWKLNYTTKVHNPLISCLKRKKEDEWALKWSDKSNFIQNFKFPSSELLFRIYKTQKNLKLFYIIALDLIQGLKIKTEKNLNCVRKHAPNHGEKGAIEKQYLTIQIQNSSCHKKARNPSYLAESHLT